MNERSSILIRNIRFYSKEPRNVLFGRGFVEIVVNGKFTVVPIDERTDDEIESDLEKVGFLRK